MKQIKLLSLMLNVLMFATFPVLVQASERVVIVSTYTDNTVVKLDSNGNILWVTNVGAWVFQAVENPTDKTIYALGGGIFTKLSRDGAILLQKSISGSVIDVDPSDGSFYVANYYESAVISKYDTNGNFINSFGNANTNAIAVYRMDGSIYANTYSSGVYKFDKNGNLLWQKQPVLWHNSYGFATIVVNQIDGNVVATAQDGVGDVVRFDTNGNTIWVRPIHDISYSRNAIDPVENVVYGADWNYIDKLYKINLANGDVIWSKSIGDGPMTPSVDPFDESIYVGNIYAKEMVKVDKNGIILWGPKNIGYYTFYLETTSPADTIPPTTTDNSPLNWQNSDFTVTLTCTDNLGGSQCKETHYSIDGGALQTGNSVSISIEGDHLIEYYSIDNAGNQETTKSMYAKLDNTAPTVECGSADGLWHGSDVSIACTTSDSWSGLANPDDSSSSLSTNVADGEETSSALTNSRNVCDKARNCATAGPISGNMADKKAPSISILAPITAGTYMLKQAIAASYSCSDGSSGMDTCNGPVPNGNYFDTSTVDSKIFTVNAKDLVGNTASSTNNYNVIYNFNGFFRPVDNIPTLNTVKAESSIPMKFSLNGNQGLNIFPSSYPISQKIDCDTSAPLDEIDETVTAGRNSLSYDATADQYNYVWKTDKAWSGTCRQMIVKLNDGTDHMANFKFR